MSAVNPLIFTVAVHGSPYGSTAHQRAQALVGAIIRAGHAVKRVFFYHEAVYVALDSRVVPQDERDVTAVWQSLARQHELELAVCIANASKRGILSAAEAERHERPHASLADDFELVGLGQLIEAVAQSDRYVEIPA